MAKEDNFYLEKEYKQKLDNIYGKRGLTHTQKLANFVDALEQDIFEATDEEIMEDFGRMGSDEIHRKIVAMVDEIYEKGEDPTEWVTR